MKITIKIYCHQRILAEGLRKLLEEERDIEVVGIFPSPDDLDTMARKEADILLADMDSYFDLKENVLATNNSKVLLIWSASWMHHVSNRLTELIAEGVAGVVPPESTPELLQKAVRAVAAGELWLNRKLLEKTVSVRRPSSALLTPQEKRVVALICQGCRNKEVAAELGITEQTVKAHCNRIYKKLGISDRLQLALYGHQNGALEGLHLTPKEILSRRDSTP